MNNEINNNNINNNIDNTQSSIHDFDFALICDYFSSIPRQGPGSDDITLKALSLIDGLPDHPLIADLGCGCGSSTLQLALNTNGSIKALDLFPLFIERTLQRCQEAGVADKVEGMVGDMCNLTFDKASFDVIWSEGAIYNIGFQRGVNEWRHFLKQGGWLAVSEASWLTDSRPEEIERFWSEAYPEMDTIYNKVEQMRLAGYKDIKTFILPDYCWTTNFYLPQKEAQRLFLQRYPDNTTAMELVGNQRREAELYSLYHDYYGYVFYVGRK